MTEYNPEEVREVIRKALKECPEELIRLEEARHLESELKRVGSLRFNASMSLCAVWDRFQIEGEWSSELRERSRVLDLQLKEIDGQMRSLRTKLPATFNNAYNLMGDPWALTLNLTPDLVALGLVPDEGVNAIDLSGEEYLQHLKEKYPGAYTDEYAECVEKGIGPSSSLPPVTQPIRANSPDIVLKG